MRQIPRKRRNHTEDPMGVSRRHFLEIGSIAAAACAVPLEAIAQERQREAVMIDDGGEIRPPRGSARILNKPLSESSLRALAGQNFTITLSSGAKATATLVAVESPLSGSTSRGTRTQSFVLRFQLNGATTTLKQGTYEFSQPNTGRFSLFIVPFSANGTNTTFTATVSNPPA